MPETLSLPLPRPVRARRTARVVSAVLVASTVVLGADVSRAGRRHHGARNLSIAVQTPLGLQGTAGAGPRAVLPIVLVDRSARRVEVDVEYGFDRNGDGTIADGVDPNLESEFRTATQARRDPRDTGRLRATRHGAVVTYRPMRFGATYGFVWNVVADLPNERHMAGAQIVRDAQGRALRDPFDPTQNVFTAALPGVVLRVRAIRRGAGRVRTDWTYSDGFAVDNSSPPSMRIDGVPVVDPVAGRVEIDWTAYDDDSEDLNGNGRLDVLDLEDVNGNGQLDNAFVAVAFDFHRLLPGEVPPASPVLLAELAWSPCTRAVGEGDPDDGVAAAPTGVGRPATFVWATAPDLGGPGYHEGRYLLRGTPYDDVGNRGEPVYYSGAIVIGEDT